MTATRIREEAVELLRLLVIALEHLVVIVVGPAREDQQVREAVIGDHLAAGLAEVLEGLVSADHVSSNLLIEVAKSVKNDDSVSVCQSKRGILVDPILEVIRCNRERDWAGKGT